MQMVPFLVSFFDSYCLFSNFVRIRASLHHPSQARIRKKLKKNIKKLEKGTQQGHTIHRKSLFRLQSVSIDF